MKSGIYIIRNKINNEKYVGGTNRLKERFGEHKSALRHNKHSNNRLQYSFNLYGESNFEFKILEYVQKNFLLEKEKDYILLLDPEYNLEKVDNKTKKFISSDETKYKISFNNKRKRKVNQYTIDGVFIKTWYKLIDASKFYNRDKTCIIHACKEGKRSANFLWRYFDIINSTRNLTDSEIKKSIKNYRKGANHCHSKKTYQYDKNKNLIKIWNSRNEVYRTLGYLAGNISSACTGVLKTYKGFIWSNELLY